MNNTLLLDYGSGGKASHRLITELFMKHFSNPVLNAMNDAALLSLNSTLIAMSTDSYVVDPIEFPGGSIGTLAVHGTVNDVAMMGAHPKYLSAAFMLEEGLQLDTLERIVASMAQACAEAGVSVVTGDTKVVPKGMVDKIFITTTGIGERNQRHTPTGHNAQAGDAVIVSGSMGNHGITILAKRQNLPLDPAMCSDSAPLNGMIEQLLATLPENTVHVLRDPTRGGLATTLNEIAQQSDKVLVINEQAIPIDQPVLATCSFLGLDPLYLANEGKLICIVPQAQAEQALTLLQSSPYGQNAAIIGTVHTATEVANSKNGQVLLKTPLGGHRLLGMLEGEQLPRIC